MPSVTFRLPPSLHERFLGLCEKRGVTPSDLLRGAIDRLVDGVDEAESGSRPAPERSAPSPTKAAKIIKAVTIVAPSVPKGKRRVGWDAEGKEIWK